MLSKRQPTIIFALILCICAVALALVTPADSTLRLVSIVIMLVAVALLIWQQHRCVQQAQIQIDQARADKETLATAIEALERKIKAQNAIVDIAPYPIWRRNADLSIAMANLSYLEAVEDIMEPSHIPELDQSVRLIAKRAMDTAMPATERKFIIVGGERKLYQITEVPIPEQQMQVGFAIDINEVDTLRKDIGRHIAAQDDFLESSASAMAVYGSDMRLKSFNNAFLALWKLDESWLESQPTYGEVLEMLRDKRSLPEQANFQHFKQMQLRMFTDLIDPQESFFYLPDGKALRVIAVPHALGGILFAYEDVTDRLALERSYNTLIAVQREPVSDIFIGK